MVIDKYFSSLRNLSCHYVEKFEKKLLLHRPHFDVLRMLISELRKLGLGGSCLHSVGSLRPGVPSRRRQSKYQDRFKCITRVERG